MYILIAEDEKNIAESLRKNFRDEGHNAYIAADGEEALNSVNKIAFDFIILDWVMPKMTGYEVCRRMRESGIKTPIILLTALGDISNKIDALNAGADDYITKPFSFKEILARINAVARRYYENSNLLFCNGLTLDLIERRVKAEGGSEIKLTQREFDLLKFMVTNKGTIVKKEDMCKAVWEIPYNPSTNICEATVKNLRKKLEEATGKNLIKNIYGEGYLLLGNEY
jgi:DNA-binding response OmpR family regulator